MQQAAVGRERLRGYGYMAAAALSWGSLPVIVGRAQGSAVVLVALRMGFGAVALGAFLAARGRADILPRRGRWLVAAMGVLLATSWVLFFAAIQRLGATAVLIGYLFPLLVALIAPILIGERRERHALPLALVGLAGVATMFAPQVGGRDALGVLFALGMAAESALLVVAARRVVQWVPGPVVAFWQNVVGVVLLAPWAVVAASGASVPWGWGALIGLVHTALAGVLFFRSVGRIPAQEAGILMYLEPVSAVWFVWAFDASLPTLWDLAGGALVVGAGIGLVVLSGRSDRRSHEALGTVGT